MASYGGLAIRVGVLLVALSILAILGWLARLPVAAVVLATIVIVHMGWRRPRQRPKDEISGIATGTSMSAPRAYHAVYVLNWLAVVALVLGFLGHALELSLRHRLLVVALVFAGAAAATLVIAVVPGPWRRAPRPTGGASAVAVSVVVSLLSLMGLAVVLDALASESNAHCLDNVKQLALAVEAYSVRSGGNLPDANAWCDRVGVFLSSQASLACPQAENASCGYAFNSALSGVALPRVQDAQHTVVIFESDAGWNAAGGPELLPDEPRHFRGDHYGFADGHVQWLVRKRLGTEKHGNPVWAKQPDADWVIWKPVLRKPEAGPHE